MSSDKNQLSGLLEMQEYLKLLELFEKRDINNLSREERLAYVEALAGTLDPRQALILYEKFELKSLGTLAKIQLYLGEYEAALHSAQKSQDTYLEATLLLASGKFLESKKILMPLPLNPKWHYFMGRCFAHLDEPKKAVSCLELSIRGYEEAGNRIMPTIVLANLANQYNSLGDLENAETTYLKAVRNLNRPEFSDFPELKSKALVNCGHHFLNKGLLRKSLRYLWKAQRVLRKAEHSPGYIRASLLLAYCFSELGHYRKSIQLLETLSPRIDYQVVDRLRYLSMAYLGKGDFESALKRLRMAEAAVGDGDGFSQAHLHVIKMEIFGRLHRWKQAQKQADESLELFKKQRDEVGYHYALSKWAWLSKNEQSAKEALEYHSKNGFRLEWNQDLLTLAVTAIRKGDLLKAKKLLLQAQCEDLPVQEAYRSFLLALIYRKQGNDPNFSKKIDLAHHWSNSREMNLLNSLILYVKLLKERDPENFNEIRHQFNHDYESLPESERKSFKIWAYELDLGGTDKYRLQFQDRTVSTDTLGFLDQIHSNHGIVIDLYSESLYMEGKQILQGRKNSAQWQVLKTLASDPNKSFTKEELALIALKKEKYHPLQDDNTVYVTLARLRKTLENDVIISCVGGTYRLCLGKGIVVITKEDLRGSAKSPRRASCLKGLLRNN